MWKKKFNKRLKKKLKNKLKIKLFYIFINFIKLANEIKDN